MARDKGHLTALQLRHWIKAGQPLAKADGDGLTFTLSAAGVAGWILRCSRRSKSEPPCRPNIEPGLQPVAGCG
jgi:hypothetical protein